MLILLTIVRNKVSGKHKVEVQENLLIPNFVFTKWHIWPEVNEPLNY